MGWLEGISTRTPMTSTSRTITAYSAEKAWPYGGIQSTARFEETVAEERTQ